LGLTLTEGNSDTLLVTGSLLASRKGERNEISLGVDGTYGENNDVKNNETLHGFAQYNRLFTDRFYGYARLDGLHDAIADVEYRFTFSPGVGYYFIKNDKTRLSAEIGPGYIYEKQGDDERGYFILRLARSLSTSSTTKQKSGSRLKSCRRSKTLITTFLMPNSALKLSLPENSRCDPTSRTHMTTSRRPAGRKMTSSW
jgi:hypothetical protein